MKTHDILTITESELAPKLKYLKIKELERHTQKILAQLGQKKYDTFMSLVIKAIPTLEGEYSQRFEELKHLIKSQLPAANDYTATDEETIRRLTVITMLLVSKKFNAILSKKK